MATTGYFLNQYFTTSLNVGGGIDDTQTTGIVIQAVSGLDITKPGIACISYSDPINTSTAEWVTYTSINGSNELQGVTRGAEGFGAKTHPNLATVAFPISESHINNLATALSIGGVATNLVETTKDEDDMASNSATALATQQSIKAYVDTQDTAFLLKSKIVAFTKDIATTTTNNVTGVGFKPTSLVVLAAVAGGFSINVGMSDSVIGVAGITQYLANTFAINTKFISISKSATDYLDGTIASYDTDGFTLTWAKTGSPTGTASIYILCLR